MGFFDKIKAGLKKTRDSITGQINSMLHAFTKIDEELFEAAENGTLEEAWGTGTAAVVSPIGELAEGDKKVTVSNNQIGPVTQKLYDELTGIQWGRLPDTHGWTMKVC